MMSNLPTAFFVENPQRIGDLVRPHFIDWRKPYVIEQTVSLNRVDYVNAGIKLTENAGQK